MGTPRRTRRYAACWRAGGESVPRGERGLPDLSASVGMRGSDPAVGVGGCYLPGRRRMCWAALRAHETELLGGHPKEAVFLPTADAARPEEGTWGGVWPRPLSSPGRWPGESGRRKWPLWELGCLLSLLLGPGGGRRHMRRPVSYVFLCLRSDLSPGRLPWLALLPPQRRGLDIELGPVPAGQAPLNLS